MNNQKLAGKRILTVEDELLLRMDIWAQIEDHGCIVVGLRQLWRKVMRFCVKIACQMPESSTSGSRNMRYIHWRTNFCALVFRSCLLPAMRKLRYLTDMRQSCYRKAGRHGSPDQSSVQQSAAESHLILADFMTLAV